MVENNLIFNNARGAAGGAAATHLGTEEKSQDTVDPVESNSLSLGSRPETVDPDTKIQMRESMRETRRFSIVRGMDFGIGSHVSVAKDQMLDNGLVCVLTVSRRHEVQDWLRTRLLERCRLYHPHVLTFYDIFGGEDEIRVVFEHPRGLNLLQFLDNCTPTEGLVRSMFQQLIFAVEYYHYMGIDGLDLTLERVFCNLQTGVIKIVDFGLLDRTPKGTRVYSLPYVAPEQLTESFASRKHNKASDVWHCGVMLYCLLFGAFPFCPSEKTSRHEHVQNIVSAKWSVPPATKISSQCHDLLRRMLTLDPVERITLIELKKHPWYLTDLPDGVLQYECLQRPSDGLLEKLASFGAI